MGDRLTFWLGTPHPSWLWRPEMTGIPLFPSHRSLAMRKTPFPRAVAPYAVDSGAFTEIYKHGQWHTTVAEYVDALDRYTDELGAPVFAAQQDSMCEPDILDHVERVIGRRPTVQEHQEATVMNLLELRAAGAKVIPTIQGHEIDDYLRCMELFASAGVDLAAEPIVAVGSVCRRQHTDEIAEVLGEINKCGLTRLHGFGVKQRGLARYAELLISADSQAWAFRARRDAAERRAGWPTDTRPPGCVHRGVVSCVACIPFALRWRERLLASIKGPR